MSPSLRHPKTPLTAALAVTLLLGGGGSGLAQDDSMSAILAVEVQDRSGRAVSVSETAEFSATTGDRTLSVLAPQESRPWEIVLYVDQQLTGSRSILLLLEALAAEAPALTALGEVRIVLAGDEPANRLRTDDPDLLAQVLLDLSLQSGGDHVLRHNRSRFLNELGDPDTVTNDLARSALAEELELIRRRQDELIHWIAGHGRPAGPRLLLLLNDSLGLDPLDFYASHLEDPTAARLDIGDLPSAEGMTQALASRGWTLVPVVVPPDPEADDERVSLRTNQSVGFRVRLGDNDADDTEEPVEPLDLGLTEGRQERLDALAGATGGFVVPDLEALSDSIARLFRRRELWIALPETPVAPVPLRLDIARPGFKVLAPRWVGGTPESIAEVRIRRSLEGAGDAGELPLRARITLEPARLATDPARFDLQVDLSGIPASRPEIDLRISIGVHVQDGDLLLHHRTLKASTSEGNTWNWSDSLPIPPATDAAVVVVHDLAGDSWGENFAEFVTETAPTVAEVGPEPKIDPGGTTGPALRLLPLPANTRTGKVRVRSQARADVDEVIFMLDGERAGVRRRSPFDLRIDLGRTPRQRSIIAIAYDDSGKELGRDGLVVNEATTSFWVRIAEPRPGRRVGPVDVATSLKVPDNRRLESIDYYWNDQKIDSTAAAPHRSRVLIPVDNPAGFIRVVATLDDGSTAEDVVLMNTQRFETEITVELVELYVVVTDRLGKPVLGLESTDFLVREEDEPQEVESFAVAGNLPLTLGLAIDSSLSLFKKLPEVQQAANGFVGSLSGERDRAFLVGFGSAPRLVHPITGSLDRIQRAIDSLEPSGNTAVWEAISLSLEELDQVDGRKALVVFYDGDDEDEQYSFRKTMEQAKRSLIPVYLIVMNDEAARTQGKGFAVRSRISKLDELARTGGGRVFYVHTNEDLAPIFAEISAELRGHYLLTYYPQRPLANPEWRPIRVEVTRDGLTARTISGYGGG